ncbi:MAG: SDR family oxidoreductase [Spirochaetia bacterium]|nr:SDR family oxidoreductase [Spirochaetia bacterium]
MESLRGMSAIITGSAQGMGKGIALALAHRGVNVAICDVKKDVLEVTAQEIREATGQKVITGAFDITDEEAVKSFVSKVEAGFGKVDILVNNAGIHPLKPIEEIESKEWDLVFNVNVKASFFFAKAVIPGMRVRKFGRIISISSEAGKNGGTVAALHYAASKGAVLAFVRNLAQQVGADGITVNAIAPGRIATAMSGAVSPEENQKFINNSITKSLGTPEDVAYAVCYLASKEASFVTAETMAVNGGTLRD